MTSSDEEKNDEAFLIVKMDLIEFAISITQVDGVGEFDKEFQNSSELKFCLGNYYNQKDRISILNIKTYLRCPLEAFNITPQSRILFFRYKERKNHQHDTFIIGFGVDAIVGLYHVVTLEQIRNTQYKVSEELKCFQINSYVEINSKLYPILDLIKLLDFTILNDTLEQLLPEKI